MSHPFIRLTFILVLLTGLLALVNNSPVRADGPVFSNNIDILKGRRTLFPVDDLIISYSPAGKPLTNIIVQTENGNLGADIYYDVTNGQAAFASGIGRMFHSPRDFVVTLTDNLITIRDQNPAGAITKTFPLNVNGAPNQNQFPTADFTGDGYADFAYLVGNNIYIVTAQDVKNIDAGVFYSQAGAAPFDLSGQWAVLAAGDFDGNGTPEIALAAAQSNHITVTLYSVDVFKNIQGQLTSITLTPSGSTTFDIPEDVLGLAMVSGVFTAGANPQTALPLEDLVVLYHYNKGSHYADLASLQIEIATLDPTTFDLNVANTTTWVKSDHNITYLSMVSGRLNFFGATDQIAATVQEFGNYSHLAVYTLDNNLNLTRATEQIHEENFSNVVSVVLGNFDQDLNAQEPINLEVGVLRYTADIFDIEAQAELLLYHVGAPTSFELTQYTSGYVGAKFPSFALTNAVNLSAGDTQGRSLLLGTPTKITAQHQQAELVLAMPPMHVDWTTPNGETQPEVFNVSAVPLGFFATYESDTSKTIASSQQGTTSFSTSLTESLETTLSYGVPDVASVSATVKSSATQEWSNSTSKTYSNYATNKFDVAAQTGFDDQLWFNSDDQNIYIYPVIGRFTCPEKNPPPVEPPLPLCKPADQKPLNVMFSGPESVSQTNISGAMVEWFQPVREPGNVFTYPWNLAQLQLLEPRINLLTSNTPTKFFTDGSGLTEHAQWEGGGSSNVTTGSTQNYSWNTSISISDDVSIPEAGGLGGSDEASFSYSGSKSFSTVNSSTTSLGESTGVGITKPNTFPDVNQYQYAIEPYIFGTNPVSGTIQTIQLDTDIQSNGVLRAEFTADPTDTDAGAWWQTTYTAPDLALNHPARWNLTAVTTGTFGANCLPIASGTTTVNCAVFNPPQTDIWGSQFYWMKGLLITPAEANGEGPQITTTTAGKEVLLQARVYNYSLADMPVGSEAIVQFYGQPWDQSTLQPSGNAFLIDQVALQAIPGFNSNSNQGTVPNWSIASTKKLDTATYEDQYLAFWIMVWMQDAQGNLIGEMPDHGLTQLPGTLDSIAAAAPLLQTYSNNVGLYKSLFYIEQPTSQSAAQSEAAERLRMDPIQLSKQTALLNEQVIVSAKVRANKEHRGARVLFYDGNPDKKGKAFEYEAISHIRGGDVHQVRTIYRAEQCGTHNLVLEIQPGGKRSEATLEVTINARASVRQLIKQVKALGLKDGRSGGGMMELLKEANKAFKNHDNATGLDALEKFQARVEAQKGKNIPAEQADLMLAILDQIFECVKR